MGRITSSLADTDLEALISSQVVDEFSPRGVLTIAGKIGWMSASELVVEAVAGREEFVPPGTKVCA